MLIEIDEVMSTGNVEKQQQKINLWLSNIFEVHGKQKDESGRNVLEVEVLVSCQSPIGNTLVFACAPRALKVRMGSLEDSVLLFSRTPARASFLISGHTHARRHYAALDLIHYERLTSSINHYLL